MGEAFAEEEKIRIRPTLVEGQESLRHRDAAQRRHSLPQHAIPPPLSLRPLLHQVPTPSYLSHNAHCSIQLLPLHCTNGDGPALAPLPGSPILVIGPSGLGPGSS